MRLRDTLMNDMALESRIYTPMVDLRMLDLGGRKALLAEGPK
jgi:hypothetical protein